VGLVAYVGMFVGLVGLVQGVAWIGASRPRARRRGQGVVLAPAAMLLWLISLLHLLVPGFFTR
jgi:hypothetical protein